MSAQGGGSVCPHLIPSWGLHAWGSVGGRQRPMPGKVCTALACWLLSFPWKTGPQLISKGKTKVGSSILCARWGDTSGHGKWGRATLCYGLAAFLLTC